MKQAIILTLFISFATASFGQQTVQSQPLTKTDYLQKSKNQKKTGRILLIGGTALLITGFVIPKGELVEEGFWLIPDEYKNDNIKAAFILAGVASDLASIPFFIASKKNRRKANAASVFIKMENATVLQQAVVRNQSFPALGIKIRFQRQ
jgi:hypothetical protein